MSLIWINSETTMKMKTNKKKLNAANVRVYNILRCWKRIHGFRMVSMYKMVHVQHQKIKYWLLRSKCVDCESTKMQASRENRFAVVVFLVGWIFLSLSFASSFFFHFSSFHCCYSFRCICFRSIRLILAYFAFHLHFWPLKSVHPCLCAISMFMVSLFSCLFFFCAHHTLVLVGKYGRSFCFVYLSFGQSSKKKKWNANVCIIEGETNQVSDPPVQLL